VMGDIDEPNAVSINPTGTHWTSSPICASAWMCRMDGFVVISLQHGDGEGRWLASCKDELALPYGPAVC
jgi:hypothetical protein